MRIALVTHKVDFQDGQGRVNYEIVMAALKEGHRVTVVAEFCSDEIANHPHGKFICVREHPIPTQLLRNLYFARKSGRWVRQHRNEFDLIQANGFVMWEPADIVAVHFVHGAWLKNRFFPFRWSSLSPYAYYQRLITIMNARYEKRAFESAKVLVAVSDSTANEVVGLGNSRNKIRVIHNAVDSSEFYPGPSERESFGLPTDPPVALFAGDIRTPRKNLETVLKAMLSIPKLHLAVAGKTEGSAYPELARTSGIADRVHFLGMTNRIAALMRSVDFFVIPSRYESYGLVVLEAMASGLPVILSANVGALEFAGDICIVISDPDDSTKLADAMTELICSPERRRAMGEAGHQRALEMQWSNTAAAYLRVYRDFLAGGV
jgi:glycosyltransferase involved in cell wall biosynthesis